jgi:hypothetical protein
MSIVSPVFTSVLALVAQLSVSEKEALRALLPAPAAPAAPAADKSKRQRKPKDPNAPKKGLSDGLKNYNSWKKEVLEAYKQALIAEHPSLIAKDKKEEFKTKLSEKLKAGWAAKKTESSSAAASSEDDDDDEDNDASDALDALNTQIDEL